MPDQPNADSVRAARRKYLQLGREIEAMPLSGLDKSNALHTHSKLGIFLEEALGSDLWRADA